MQFDRRGGFRPQATVGPRGERLGIETGIGRGRRRSAQRVAQPGVLFAFVAHGFSLHIERSSLLFLRVENLIQIRGAGVFRGALETPGDLRFGEPAGAQILFDGLTNALPCAGQLPRCGGLVLFQ